jgi:hypothetical protein
MFSLVIILSALRMFSAVSALCGSVSITVTNTVAQNVGRLKELLVLGRCLGEGATLYIGKE